MTAYQKATLAQAEAWVNGFSYHSSETDECCPDFSCCMPDMFEKNKDKRSAILTELQIKYGLIQCGWDEAEEIGNPRRVRWQTQ